MRVDKFVYKVGGAQNLGVRLITVLPLRPVMLLPLRRGKCRVVTHSVVSLYTNEVGSSPTNNTSY